MTISEWLNRKGLTHEEFALICGCDRSSVTKWVTGERFPSPRWMKVILRVTKGQVFTAENGELTHKEQIYFSLYKQGLTLSSAAKKLGIHRNTLSRFLHGVSSPPPDILARIRKLSGVQ